MHVFPEDVAVAALAMRLGRPVKWIEPRRENLAAASQAREQRLEAEVAADAGGRVLALKARVVSDAGASHGYPITAAPATVGPAPPPPGPYPTAGPAYPSRAAWSHKPSPGAQPRARVSTGAF